MLNVRESRKIQRTPCAYDIIINSSIAYSTKYNIYKPSTRYNILGIFLFEYYVSVLIAMITHTNNATVDGFEQLRFDLIGFIVSQ